MALTLIEGFDMGNHKDHYYDKWIEFRNISPGNVAGRYGGFGVGFAGAGSWYAECYSGDPGTTNELIIGWAFKCSSISPRDLMRLYDGVVGSWTMVCKFELQSDGTIDLIVDGVVKSSTTKVAIVNAWQYVEIKILLKTDATGSISWQIDGQPDTVTPNIKTIYTSGSPTEATMIYWSGQQYIDDVYVAHTGGSGLVDFAGDCQVTTTLPVGDDAVQFTPTEATNWQGLIDILTPISSSYNQSPTSGHQDTFDHAASGIPVDDIIHGVSIEPFANKPTGGVVDMNIIRKRSTTTVGAPIRAVSGYVRFFNIYEEDPDAGPGAWTVANLDATKFGYKRT
jgi:hypothetical protein